MWGGATLGVIRLSVCPAQTCKCRRFTKYELLPPHTQWYPMRNFPRKDKKGRIKETRYTFVLYPDSTSYDYNESLLWLREHTLNYCFALHDKDFVQETGEIKKVHYHVYCQFENPRLLDSVAENLFLHSNDIVCVNPDDINGKGVESLIRYFAHDTQKARLDNKTPYDYHSFDSNMDLDSIFLGQQSKQTIRFRQIIDFINEADYYISYKMITQFALDNDCISELIRGNWVLRGLLNEHNDFIQTKQYKEEHQAFCDNITGFSRVDDVQF